ncbi:hypothetical protein GGF46_003644 [Coemansia sp. RSA 552]|nr:hypothetical protein GGF46_003644 [Coemansia sp. RSA 552]
MPELDGDVLQLIHEYVFAKPQCEDWEKQLALLAVCHSWRVHLLTAVYKKAFIIFEEDHADCRPKSTDRGAGCNITNTETNIRLVQELGLTGIIKSIHISNTQTVVPFPELLAVMRVLEESGDWSAVAELELDITGSFSSPFDIPDKGQHRKYLASLTDSMRTRLPNLTRLYFPGTRIHQSASSIPTKILESYLCQVKELCSHDRIKAGNQDRLTQLAHLELCGFNFRRNQCPLRACPDVLVSLKLERCLLSTLRVMFEDVNAAAPGALVFPRLQHLDLKLLQNTSLLDQLMLMPDYANTYELHFPALKTLVLRGGPDNIVKILQCSTLPSRMDSIELDLCTAVFELMGEVELPKADKATLNVYIKEGEPVDRMSSVPSEASHIFKRVGASAEVSLELFNYFPRISYNLVGLQELTYLYLHADVDIEMVLRVLGWMHRLQTLYFTINEQDPIYEIPDSEADNDPAKPVAPLNSSLKYLHTGFNGYCNETTHSVLAKYLLLRLPRLELYESKQTHYEEIAEFIEQHASQYPHLRRIKLDLGHDGTQLPMEFLPLLTTAG